MTMVSSSHQRFRVRDCEFVLLGKAFEMFFAYLFVSSFIRDIFFRLFAQLNLFLLASFLVY